MNVFRPTWRAEWRQMVRDRSLLLASSLIAVLTVAAVVGGAAWVQFQTATLDAVRAASRIQHETYKRDAGRYLAEHATIALDAPQHPVSVYWKRAYAWRPPAPGAVLKIGQSDVFPYYTVFHGVEEQVLHYAAEIQNPLHLLIGKLDVSFLAIYVLPLLVIALTYDLLSADRESGRLLLVKAQGVSLPTWAAARLALRGLVIIGVFTLTLVASLAATAPHVLGTPAFLQFVLLATSYAAFWCLMAFALNARGYSSTVNGIVLVAAWIVCVFAVPTLLESAASARQPVPSRNRQALEEAIADAEVDAARPKYLEQYLKLHPELRVQGSPERRPSVTLDWYPGFITYQVAVRGRTADYESAIREAVLARERLVRRLRFASPAVVLQVGFERLAGVGVDDYLDYQERVDRFREAWRGSVRAFIFRNEYLAVEDFDRLPVFDDFAPPPVAPRAREFLGDLAWLVLLCIGLAWMAVRPGRAMGS
jgi:ABC-2 type transport system permease protein